MSYKRILEVPSKSFFLLGPRGTGKSSWLRDYFKPDLTIDLLKTKTFLELSADPSLIRSYVEVLPKKSKIVIDEVQKLPALLDEVHSLLFDYKNDYQFALTGSSARKLKKQKANWLAGRAINHQFFTLTYKELAEDFNLEEVLKFGALPEVHNLQSESEKIDYLMTYVENYLTEEVQQEAAARNLQSYHRFLNHAALMNGQVVNLNSISREASVNRQTLESYFQILKDTLLGDVLEPIQLRAKVKEVAKPKFYFFDCGIVRALQNNLREDLGAEKGFLFETYILNELRAFSNYHRKNWKFYYWGTPSENEVDFIISVGKKMIGIEVKASKKWKKEYNKGLRTLLQEKKIDTALAVYMGESNLIDENIKILTLPHFLKSLETL